MILVCKSRVISGTDPRPHLPLTGRRPVWRACSGRPEPVMNPGDSDGEISGDRAGIRGRRPSGHPTTLTCRSPIWKQSGAALRPTLVGRGRPRPDRTGSSDVPSRPARPDPDVRDGPVKGARFPGKTRTISLIVNATCTLRGGSCEPRIVRLEEYLYPWRSRKEAELWRGPLVASRTSPCRRTPTREFPCPGSNPTVSVGQAERGAAPRPASPDVARGRGSARSQVHPSRTATHGRGPRRRWKAANDYES